MSGEYWCDGWRRRRSMRIGTGAKVGIDQGPAHRRNLVAVLDSVPWDKTHRRGITYDGLPRLGERGGGHEVGARLHVCLDRADIADGLV